MKSKLAAAVANENSGALTLQEAEKAVEALFSAIADALANGKRAEARGFGAFSVRLKAARSARNPRTGESVQVAAKNVVVFKPGKELRDRISPPKKA